MEPFGKKLQDEARRIKLTSQEKDAMRSVVLSVVRKSNAPRPRRSPYARFLRPAARAAFASVLAVSVAGSGVAYAAQGTLPGDTLYPVKINITEPIAGALQFSPSAEAAWQASVAEKRVSEAEALAAKGRLTQNAVVTIQSNFDAHAAAAARLIAQEQKSNPPAEVALSSKTGAALAAHGAILSMLGGEASSTAEATATEELAVHITSQSQTLLALGAPQEEPAASAAETVSAASATSAASTSVQTIRTLSTAATSATATPATSAPAFSKKAQTSLHQPSAEELSELRATALAEIAKVEQGSEASQFDATTTAQLQNGLALARDAIAGADALASSSPRGALSQYRQALVKAVSLETFLKAAVQLGNGHLLPTIINAVDGASAPSEDPNGPQSQSTGGAAAFLALPMLRGGTHLAHQAKVRLTGGAQ